VAGASKRRYPERKPMPDYYIREDRRLRREAKKCGKRISKKRRSDAWNAGMYSIFNIATGALLAENLRIGRVEENL
jgi:hypothetical protein